MIFIVFPTNSDAAIMRPCGDRARRKENGISLDRMTGWGLDFSSCQEALLNIYPASNLIISPKMDVPRCFFDQDMFEKTLQG